jgi:hypothetical protein
MVFTDRASVIPSPVNVSGQTVSLHRGADGMHPGCASFSTAGPKPMLETLGSEARSPLICEG